MFYIPFCTFNFQTTEEKLSLDVIVAKSADEPPRWKAGQNIAIIPSAKPTQPGPIRAFIDYSDANAPTVHSSTGVSSWTNHDMKCTDICLQSSTLLGFSCTGVLLERDEQNSHLLYCRFYDDEIDDSSVNVEYTPNADFYVNTNAIEAKGCKRDKRADQMAIDLQYQQSSLNSVPTFLPETNSSPRRSKRIFIFATLAISVIIHMF